MQSLLTYAQAAKALGMSEGALRKRVFRGTIPYIRFGARTVRFDPEDLRRGRERPAD